MNRVLLALAIAALVPAAAGAFAPAPIPVADVANVVSMSLIGFNPPVIVVPQGITVLFQNHDATEHTVNSIAGDTLNAVLPAGYHYLVTLTEQEVIPYHCLRHAWMNGVVVVA